MNWYQSNDAKRVFADLRKAKGRTGTIYRQVDVTTGKLVDNFAPDPILILYVARAGRMNRPSHYGEIRQRVVSPVALPDMRK